MISPSSFSRLVRSIVDRYPLFKSVDRVGDLDVPEDADDLADIPDEAEDVPRTAALADAEPLHLVLLVRIPEEWIAHGASAVFETAVGLFRS